MLAIVGFVLLLIVVVVVKLFDDNIREAQWKKAMVNVTAIAGVVFIIVGLIQLIFMQ